MMEETNITNISNVLYEANHSNPFNSRILQDSNQAYLILVTIMMVVIVTGNSMVIYAIMKFDWLHTPSSYMLLSMAVSDLLVGAVALPLFTAYNNGLLRHIISPVTCSVVFAIDPTLAQVSMFHLLIVNIDRYMAIRKPLHYHTIMTCKVLAGLIGLCWILSFLVCVLPLLIGTTTFTAVQGICHANSPRQIYILHTGIFLGLLLVICIFYCHIVLIARKHIKAVNNVPSVTSVTSVTSGDTSQKKVSIKSNIRLLRTVALVIGVFLFSWLPFSVAGGFLLVVPSKITVDTYIIFTWLSFVVYLSSALNPVIYPLSHIDFKKAFKIMLHCTRNTE